MIKNIIFDYGQVLVHADWNYVVGQYVTDPRDAAQLAEVIFDRLYWDRLDAATVSDEEVLAGIKSRIPERLYEKVELIYKNWIYHLPPMEGMEELLVRLKALHGVRLYLLSNISEYFAAHAGEKPVFRHFDGLVFSSICKKVKPSREIFEHICTTFGLVPEECVFIDDSPKNIDGALAFGIHAYLFDGDAEKLSRYLDEILE